MTKIKRTRQEIFGDSAGSRQITAFGTAKSENPTFTRELSEIQNTNFLYGWDQALLPDKAPFEEDMNGLFYAITKQLAYIFQEGIPEYDPSTEYSQNALARGIGSNIIYSSVIPENKGNALDDPNYWVPFITGGTLANYEIGLPQPTFSNNLLSNEIWLEGQALSRTLYSKLFEIYGTTYGAGDGSTTFNVPDCRDRVFWGATNFGYVNAQLPNITGNFTAVTNARNAQGAFSRANGGYAGVEPENNRFHFNDTFYFDASKSNPIYTNNGKLIPPGIKVRVKTRYV